MSVYYVWAGLFFLLVVFGAIYFILKKPTEVKRITHEVTIYGIDGTIEKFILEERYPNIGQGIVNTEVLRHLPSVQYPMTVAPAPLYEGKDPLILRIVENASNEPVSITRTED